MLSKLIIFWGPGQCITDGDVLVNTMLVMMILINAMLVVMALANPISGYDGSLCF